MRLLQAIKEALLHLAFPHVCEGCRTDTLPKDHYLCVHCLEALPKTAYPLHADNPVEQLFWGRLPLHLGAAHFYFTRESTVQHLVHQFKYFGHKDLGLYLGRLMGYELQASHRFGDIEAIVPLPLHASRERRRGFNQARVLSQGIAEVLWKPVLDGRSGPHRAHRKSDQKDPHRTLAEHAGQVPAPEPTPHRRPASIILVDDVVTTGATLEACGQALLQAPGVSLSIATLCTSSGN